MASVVAPAAPAAGERPTASGPDSWIQKDGTMKAGKTRTNVAGVIGEALRDAGQCLHVEHPQAPTFLLGDEAVLRALPDEIERNIEAHQKKYGGRKLRADAHVLLAGVASFPKALAQAEPGTYERWQTLTMDFLKRKYGTRLRAVLRHDDEEHPHLHFYVVDAERPNAKELHAGYVAAASYPALSKESVVAFKEAMRDFQSAYYAEVGHSVGLLRDGPKRKRMPRSEYLAHQREARERVALDGLVATAHSELLDIAASEAKRLSDLRREVESEKGLLAVELTELEQLRAMVEQERDGLAARGSALDAGWERYRQKAAALSAKEAEVNKGQDQLARDLLMLTVREARVEYGLKSGQEMRDGNDITRTQLERERADVRKLSEVLVKGKTALADAVDISELVKRPELAGMLQFLAQNTAARDAVAIMQSDADMVPLLVSAVQTARALGADPTTAEWGHLGQDVDWAAVQAASDAAASVNISSPGKDNGLDFSL